MQPMSGGGGGGGNELSRGNLQRFNSAPATWLEALLESELDNEVILDPPPTSSSSLISPPSTSSPPRKPPPPLPPIHPPPPRTPPSSSLSRHPSADLSFLDSVTVGGGGGGGLSGFLRQNSSPAEFLSAINSEGFFSGFGVPGTVDYLLPSTLNQSASKRPRGMDLETTTSKLASSPLKVEQSAESQDIVGLLDAELDKLTEDAVLCRVRAKRGCATHPRSIAERVRRTRISDRIRKLQELVPNMDKQTNTADMLDEAVEYVKFLQKQIQELTEHQKRCRCSMKE